MVVQPPIGPDAKRGVTGKDLAESAAASSEDSMNQCLVLFALAADDFWLHETPDVKQAAVDAWSRCECRGRDPALQGEAEPWRPLRGHHCGVAHPGATSGDLPLDEHDRICPAGGMEKVAQHGRGQVERQVADDHVWADG